MMDRRSTPTRRRWLAACGGTTAGIAALAGCAGSNNSDETDSPSSSGEEGNGDETTENGAEEESNASSTNGSWPMSKFTANNGMVTNEWSGPDGPLEERWTVEIEDSKISGPVVGNGFVYVADEMSRLHAIGLETGDVEWMYEPELPPRTPPNPQWEPTTPAVTDDAVYFLTETLYALDPEKGDVLWSVEFGSLYSGDIRVYDGIVYVHNDGKLYAIDINEQQVIWEEQVNSVQDIAVDDDGTLYVSHKTNNGHDYEVVGFNVEGEGEIWSNSPSGSVDSGRGLMVHDGTVYTHELDTVLAIDGETGEEETIVVYNDNDDESVIAGRTPTIADEVIYSPGVFDQSAVFSRELENGEQPSQWNSDKLPSGPTGRRMFVSSDTLYVWRGYGYVDLNAIDPETGKQQWSFDVRDHQDMIRGMTQGYAILEDAVIYCIDGNYSVIGALQTS